jgi:hypothetical protein
VLHGSHSSAVYATKQPHKPEKHNHSNEFSTFRYTNSAQFLVHTTVCVSYSGLVCLSNGKNLSHKVYAILLRQDDRKNLNINAEKQSVTHMKTMCTLVQNVPFKFSFGVIKTKSGKIQIKIQPHPTIGIISVHDFRYGHP